MNEDKASFYAEKCRLCLMKPGVEDVFETFDLIQDIYLCIGIKIVRNNFPRKICTQCLEIVSNAKHLRALATANESHLTLFFNKEEIQTSHETNSEVEDTINNMSSINEREENTGDLSPDIISFKRDWSSSTEHITPDHSKKIAVRKDLFDSTNDTLKIPITTHHQQPTLDNDDASIITSTKPTEHEVSSKTCEKHKLENVTYTCAWCPKTFNTWKKVYCHQRQHNKTIKCPIELCWKKFCTRGDMEKHLRTHTGERPFVCNICDRSFAQRCTLKSHEKNVHQNETFIVP